MSRKLSNGADLQSQKIINLADPSANTDAANKQYVDNVARGLVWKDAVQAASTANVTVSSAPATLDGVTLAANDRVLLKNQTAPAENGIYVFTAAASALTRALDADTGTELRPGTAVSVNAGTTQADTVWHVTSPDTAVTIGTTGTTWSALGGGTTYTAGNGINVTGTVISAVAATGGGLTVAAGGIGIDTSLVVRKFAVSIGTGAATSIAVNHALGTRDVQVTIYDNTTFEEILADVVHTDANNVTLTFAVAPATNAYRVVVQG